MKDTAQEIAEPNTILRGLVGSTIHGLGVSDGVDDRDEMGVCCEPKQYVIGLKSFDQWVFRTAAKDQRSGPGDLDLTVYSLRKWCRLALNGNPTVLLLLFVPVESLVVNSELGARLQHMAPHFAARNAGRRFLGYLHAQKQRLLGLKGSMVNRPELVEKYGFDTKFAMHMLRLGYQGVEYLQTGRLSLPIRDPERSFLRSVRRGEVDKEACVKRAETLEGRIGALINGDSPLPERPNRDAVQKFVIEAYETHWA